MNDEIADNDRGDDFDFVEDDAFIRDSLSNRREHSIDDEGDNRSEFEVDVVYARSQRVHIWASCAEEAEELAIEQVRGEYSYGLVRDYECAAASVDGNPWNLPDPYQTAGRNSFTPGDRWDPPDWVAGDDDDLDSGRLL